MSDSASESHELKSAKRIARSSRACTQCRSRKQKCAGPRHIPCERCVNAQIRCSFEYDRDSFRVELAPHTEGVGLGVAEIQPAHRGGPLPSILARLARLERLAGLTSGLAVMEEPAMEGSVPELVGTGAGTDSGAGTGADSCELVSSLLSLGSEARAPSRMLEGLSSRPGPARPDAADKIERGLLGPKEPEVLFNIFFAHCHPVAPFLDPAVDNSVDTIRASNDLLLLAILTTAARYANFSPDPSAAQPSWLHGSYHSLVRLVDQQLLRLITQPNANDDSLQTIQALLILVHWCPLDREAGGCRSRFSESSWWNMMGLATRWAVHTGLERRALQPFLNPDIQPTAEDVRAFRTWVYLVESDHYLAITTRQPTSIDPRPTLAGLDTFLSHPQAQPSDHRLGTLLKIACATRQAGDDSNDLSFKAVTPDSVQAFNIAVAAIERSYLEPLAASYEAAELDPLALHFPFTAIRWYQLAMSCSFLGHRSVRSAELVQIAIDWATQILSHVSLEACTSPIINLGWSNQLYSPNPALVTILSFSIDQHYVVLSYAACFLVIAWHSGAIDDCLRPTQRFAVLTAPPPALPFSPLYRFVKLTADALTASSSAQDHSAQPYAKLLHALAELVLRGERPPPLAAGAGLGSGLGAGAYSGEGTPLLQFDASIFEDLVSMAGVEASLVLGEVDWQGLGELEAGVGGGLW